MKDTKIIEKTPFDIYMERVAKERKQYRKELEARGVIFTEIDLGSGPAMDYNKGPGNWTGD